MYTKIVKRCGKTDLMPIIKGKILEESTVYTDGWKSYDGLVLMDINTIEYFIPRMNLLERKVMLTK